MLRSRNSLSKFESTISQLQIQPATFSLYLNTEKSAKMVNDWICSWLIADSNLKGIWTLLFVILKPSVSCALYNGDVQSQRKFWLYNCKLRWHNIEQRGDFEPYRILIRVGLKVIILQKLVHLLFSATPIYSVQCWEHIVPKYGDRNIFTNK